MEDDGKRNVRHAWGKRVLLACDGWNSEYAPKRGGLVSVSMAEHKGVISI
jgi:hypothetical protein